MCKHRTIVERDSGYVCAKCGLVIGPVLSYLPPRNVGISRTSETYHDYDIGGEVPKTFHIDAQRLLDYREKKLVELFCEIDKICDYMSLPRTAQRMLCHFSRKLVGNVSGISYTSILADLVFIVCRNMRIPRDIREIDAAFRDLYGKQYRPARRGRMTKIFGMAKKINLPIHRASPEDYVDRLAYKMGMPWVIPTARLLIRDMKHKYSSPVACAKSAIKRAASLRKKAEPVHREREVQGL